MSSSEAETQAGRARSVPGPLRRRAGRGGNDRPADGAQRLPAPRRLLRPQDRPRAAHPGQRRGRAQVLRLGLPGVDADRLRPSLWLDCVADAAAAVPDGGGPLLRGVHPDLLRGQPGGRAVPGIRLLRLGGHLQPHHDRPVLVLRERDLQPPRRQPALPADRRRIGRRRPVRGRDRRASLQAGHQSLRDDGDRGRPAAASPRPLPRRERTRERRSGEGRAGADEGRAMASPWCSRAAIWDSSRCSSCS